MVNSPFSSGQILTESEIPKPPSPLVVLLPLLEEIPLHPHDSGSGRGRQLMLRAFLLLALSATAYIPCFWGTLLDGERERLAHLTPPELPLGSLRQLSSWFELGPRVPHLLRILVYIQHGPEGSTPIFQFTGLCLHAFCALFLWLVLRRLGQPAAWLAAILFALHPANVPAVAWVSQQGRLWAMLFSLIGTLLLLRNRGIPPEATRDLTDYLGQQSSRGLATFKSIVSYAAALLSFAAAALCQPTAAVVPVMVTLLIAWKKKLQHPDRLLLVPLALLFGLATAVALYFGASHTAHAVTAQSPLLTKLLLPTGQIVVDALLLHSPRTPWLDASPLAVNTAIALGLFCFLSLPILFTIRRKLGTGPAIAIAAFLLLLPTDIAPVAVHVSGQTMQGIMNPGSGYLADIPILLLLATAIYRLSLKIPDEPLRALAQLLVGLALAAALGTSTVFGAQSFDSTETLLKSAVKVDPKSYAARSRLAEYYLSQTASNRFELAEDQLQDAQLNTLHDADTAVAKGDYLQAKGQLDAAAQWYDQGQKISGTNSTASGRLAALYIRQNRITDAIDTYQHAIIQHPSDPSLPNDLGLLYNTLNRPDPALEQFYKSLKNDPDYVPAHINLANALITRGKLADAAQELQTAVSIDPDNFEAFHNAGFVLAQLHEYDRALRMLTTAVQLKPDSPQARNDLGVVLVAAGKYNRAIFEFEQALEQAPDYASARHNLDIAKRRLAAQKAEGALHAPAKAEGS